MSNLINTILSFSVSVLIYSEIELYNYFSGNGISFKSRKLMKSEIVFRLTHKGLFYSLILKENWKFQHNHTHPIQTKRSFKNYQRNKMVIAFGRIYQRCFRNYSRKSVGIGCSKCLKTFLKLKVLLTSTFFPGFYVIIPSKIPV